MATDSRAEKLRSVAETAYSSVREEAEAEMPIRFGPSLQAEREQRGWTRQQLAEKLGITESEVRKREELPPTYPKESFRRKLAEVLGKDIYATLDEALGAEVGNQGVPLPPQPTPTPPTKVQGTPQSVEILFCYARKDQQLLNELKNHLIPLQRQGLITIWADTDIGAGAEWEKEIEKHLNTAQIILLLVSPDFIASEYCYSIEMKRAVERHERGDARVIPVILRPIYWQGAPFSKLQALPKDAKPVKSWLDLDEALLSVAEGIRKAVEEMTTS